MPEQETQLPIILDPQTERLIRRLGHFAYVTTAPTWTPDDNGVPVVYFDGTNYYLYIYANGGWRSVKVTLNEASTILTTQGDILYRDGSGLARLGAGTSGQYLETQGAGANPQWKSKFGGTGADGALSIGSGTTTLSFGGNQYLVKNYTTLSITSTALLTFSNPHDNGSVAILRVQGDVTITANAPCIDARGMGGAGGVSTTSTGAGIIGTPGVVFLAKCMGGEPGGATITLTGDRTGGLPGSYTSFTEILLKYPIMAVGGGGGSGHSTNNFDSGAGGRGGGCVIIECGGALNFTTASGVDVSGGAGGNGEVNGGGTGGGGGGGGGGGMFVCFYNTLTANSGSVVVTGGSVGTSDDTVNGGGAAGTAADGDDASGQAGAGISIIDR